MRPGISHGAPPFPPLQTAFSDRPGAAAGRFLPRIEFQSDKVAEMLSRMPAPFIHEQLASCPFCRYAPPRLPAAGCSIFRGQREKRSRNSVENRCGFRWSNAARGRKKFGFVIGERSVIPKSVNCKDSSFAYLCWNKGIFLVLMTLQLRTN